MLRHLPNSLTALRLLLAAPLGLMILRGDYASALAIGCLAGVTDALDGFLARRLNAQSRLGAALDPVSDKILITVTFVCFAQMGLAPWYLAIIVFSRDIIIVIGAIAYHKMIGPFEFSATRLSKGNMCVQISFCVLVLLAQVIEGVAPILLFSCMVAVLFFAVASGLDYSLSWTIKALQVRKARRL